MLCMMLERGIRVDRILFADVGEMAEFEQQYDYLAKIEAYTGRNVEVVRSDRYTARSIFYGYPTRGQHMDEIRGFPPTIGAGCRYRSWLKVEPLELASALEERFEREMRASSSPTRDPCTHNCRPSA